MHTWSRSKESRHCVSSCVSLGYQTQRKPCHTGGRDEASLRSEFSCESSSFVIWRRTYYTWSRSEAGRHCVSSCDALYLQTQRKPCHTGGRNKVFLWCVTLHISRPRESLVTLGAGIKFFSGVNFHVRTQVLSLEEGPSAFGARIRCHATMSPLVGH